MVVGSNPTEPTKSPVLTEDLDIRELLDLLLGQLNDQKFDQLAGAITSLARKVKSRQEASKYDIIDRGLAGVLNEAKALRTDIKPFVESSIANLQVRQHPPREEASFSRGMTLGIEKERKLEQ